MRTRPATKVDVQGDARRVAKFADPATPVEALAEIAGTRHYGLRARIGRNPNTTPAILVALGADEEPMVRERVAANPHTPPSILSRLATDISPGVRAIAALNPATPGATRVKLALDADPDVVDALRRAMPQLPWTTHRPSYVQVENEHLYNMLAKSSDNPALFAGLAPTWTSSLNALLTAVAEISAPHPHSR